MKKNIKSLVLAMSILAFFSWVTPVRASDDAGFMAVDALLLRPLGIVAIVIGTALFIVSSPFSVMTGTLGDSADSFIMEPIRFTFKRPFGTPPDYSAQKGL